VCLYRKCSCWCVFCRPCDPTIILCLIPLIGVRKGFWSVKSPTLSVPKVFLCICSELDLSRSTVTALSIPPPGQTSDQRHDVFNLSTVQLCIYLSVCYPTCERDMLKTNKLILMEIGTSTGSTRRKGMKQAACGSWGGMSGHIRPRIDLEA